MPTLLEALTLVALMAATLEYAMLMRHREARRDAMRWQEDVRVSLLSVSGPGPVALRSWSDDGTRFRATRGRDTNAP